MLNFRTFPVYQVYQVLQLKGIRPRTSFGVDTQLPYKKQPMRAAVAATKNIKKVAI